MNVVSFVRMFCIIVRGSWKDLVSSEGRVACIHRTKAFIPFPEESEVPCWMIGEAMMAKLL